MDLGETVKTVIIGVLLLALVWRGCDTIPSEPNDVNIEYYTDTTYVTHVDTVLFRKDTTITKTLLSYTYVERIKEDTSKLYTFKSHVSDSLINGEITTKVKVKDSVASLINQTIAYTPLFPKYIHQTDSVFIKDSTVITKYDDKLHLLLGADIGILGEQGTVIPKIGLQLKNKSILEVGFDPFSKNIMFGAKFKLRFKK